MKTRPRTTWSARSSTSNPVLGRTSMAPKSSSTTQQNLLNPCSCAVLPSGSGPRRLGPGILPRTRSILRSSCAGRRRGSLGARCRPTSSTRHRRARRAPPQLCATAAGPPCTRRPHRKENVGSTTCRRRHKFHIPQTSCSEAVGTATRRVPARWTSAPAVCRRPPPRGPELNTTSLSPSRMSPPTMGSQRTQRTRRLWQPTSTRLHALAEDASELRPQHG
mmetsp:Transcript_115736/g.323681  ORF Transcript_115736/g.323681 Transcript_115736/m.323681 type:complete len:220 (+) Transcript_115736:174-833(+)